MATIKAIVWSLLSGGFVYLYMTNHFIKANWVALIWIILFACQATVSMKRNGDKQHEKFVSYHLDNLILLAINGNHETKGINNMAKIMYNLAIVAMVVMVVGVIWTIFVNLTNGILMTVLGWVSAWILMQLAIIVEEYHK